VTPEEAEIERLEGAIQRLLEWCRADETFAAFVDEQAGDNAMCRGYGFALDEVIERLEQILGGEW